MLRKPFFLTTIATLILIVSSFLFAAEEWTKSEIEGKDVEFRNVYFADEHNGWAVGDDAFEQKGMIAQTTNRGATWTFYEAPFDTALYDVFFISPKIGWAVGVRGIIVATTDGGKKWNIQTSKVDNDLYGVFFVDEKRGWAIGMGQTILRTANGGKRWEVLMGGMSVSAVGEGDIMLLDAYFMRKEVEGKEKIFGWAVGQSGVILYTEDAEKKPSNPEDVWNIWNKQEVKDAEDVLIEGNFEDIFFADENNGWIVGAEGRILHTTDSGKTWLPVVSDTEEDLKSIYFAPKEQTGWIVGTYGTVLYTSDDGATWKKENVTAAKRLKLNDVFAFNSKNCWIASEWDTILRYTK